MDDFKLQLSTTDYAQVLSTEPSPLSTSRLSSRCVEKMVDEFNYMRSVVVDPLAKFLDYITYSYMIDNVILLITGTLHGRDTRELLERCHPLGMFDTLPALCVATNVADLYHTVIIDTPLGKILRHS